MELIDPITIVNLLNTITEEDLSEKLKIIDLRDNTTFSYYEIINSVDIGKYILFQEWSMPEKIKIELEGRKSIIITAEIISSGRACTRTSFVNNLFINDIKLQKNSSLYYWIPMEKLVTETTD